MHLFWVVGSRIRLWGGGGGWEWLAFLHCMLYMMLLWWYSLKRKQNLNCNWNAFTCCIPCTEMQSTIQQKTLVVQFCLWLSHLPKYEFFLLSKGICTITLGCRRNWVVKLLMKWEYCVFSLSWLSCSVEPPSGTLFLDSHCTHVFYMEVFLSVINFVELNHDIYLIEVLLYRLIRYWLYVPVCYHNLK